MSKFVVINFPDTTMIAQGVGALKKLCAEGGIGLYGSAVVAKDSSGKLSVQKVTKEGHGGTVISALIGGLAGLPLGALAATVGATGGAIFGVSADLVHQSEGSKFVDKFARELERGNTAVVAEVAEDGVTAFEAVMTAVGGVVVREAPD